MLLDIYFLFLLRNRKKGFQKLLLIVGVISINIILNPGSGGGVSSILSNIFFNSSFPKLTFVSSSTVPSGAGELLINIFSTSVNILVIILFDW